MKLHPEIKTQWVAALRSGKYKQGHNVLRSATNQFCCLGVLCDILPDELVKWNREKDYCYEAEMPSNGKLGGRSATSLPDALEDDLGLNDRTIINRLMNMNDTQGKTFDEIADYIETAL
jgi:hypothetical protein